MMFLVHALTTEGTFIFLSTGQLLLGIEYFIHSFRSLNKFLLTLPVSPATLAFQNERSSSDIHKLITPEGHR